MPKGQYQRKTHGYYNCKTQISINLDEKSLQFLQHLKKTKHIKSISEGIRLMLKFSIPFLFYFHLSPPHNSLSLVIPTSMLPASPLQTVPPPLIHLHNPKYFLDLLPQIHPEITFQKVINK